MSEAAKSAQTADAGYESDRPRNGVIFGTIVAGLALVGGVLIGMNELYKHLFEAELDRKVYQYQGPELRELHAAEDAKLNHYQWVDSKHEVLRVPLDRAKELTLAAYRAPLPPPPAAPPAEAADGPEGKADEGAKPSDAPKKAPSETHKTK